MSQVGRGKRKILIRLDGGSSELAGRHRSRLLPTYDLVQRMPPLNDSSVWNRNRTTRTKYGAR